MTMQDLPALPDVVRERLAPALAALGSEIHDAVIMGRDIQRWDLTALACARLNGGGGYLSGQEATMAAVMGGADKLVALRQARIDRRRGERQSTGEGTDSDTALLREVDRDLSNYDPDRGAIQRNQPPAPVHIVRNDEDEEHDCESCDRDGECGCTCCDCSDDNASSCCGCCSECDLRHEDAGDEYRYEVRLRNGNCVHICTECSHQCFQDR